MSAGIDPGEAISKKAKKVAATEIQIAEAVAEDQQFENVAFEWHSKHAPNWKPSHASKIIGRLKADVFPWLGKRKASEITAPELLSVLRRIEARGALETAHCVLAN